VSHFTHLGQKPQRRPSPDSAIPRFFGDLRAASRGTLRALSPSPQQTNSGGNDMEWTTPEFVEVKMDAEINSYQDDFSGI
jgi:hypothetical protein